MKKPTLPPLILLWGTRFRFFSHKPHRTLEGQVFLMQSQPHRSVHRSVRQGEIGPESRAACFIRSVSGPLGMTSWPDLQTGSTRPVTTVALYSGAEARSWGLGVWESDSHLILKQLSEAGTLIIPMLQMRQPRLREV